MESKIKNYDQAIGLLRSILILLVVLGHINNPLSKIIYSFHMPLFFMVSGAFMAGESSMDQLRKNTKKLLIPAILFFIIGFFVTYIKNIYLYRENESLIEAIRNLIIWGDSKHIKNYAFVIWFLIVLFWGKIIANLLIFKNSNHEVTIILISILIINLLSNYNIFIIPLGIDIAIFVTPFILLGYLTYSRREIILKYQHYFILISLVTMICIIKYYGIQWVDIGARYYENYTLSTLYSYAIFVIIYIFFSNNFFKKNFFKYLIFFGEISLFIMILHPYTNNIADKLINEILISEGWLYIFFLSIILCLVSFYLYNKIYVMLKAIKNNA